MIVHLYWYLDPLLGAPLTKLSGSAHASSCIDNCMCMHQKSADLDLQYFHKNGKIWAQQEQVHSLQLDDSPIKWHQIALFLSNSYSNKTCSLEKLF